jgi:hypothetical protein
MLGRPDVWFTWSNGNAANKLSTGLILISCSGPIPQDGISLWFQRFESRFSVCSPQGSRIFPVEINWSNYLNHGFVESSDLYKDHRKVYILISLSSIIDLLSTSNPEKILSVEKGIEATLTYSSIPYSTQDIMEIEKLLNPGTRTHIFCLLHIGIPRGIRLTGVNNRQRQRQRRWWATNQWNARKERSGKERCSTGRETEGLGAKDEK